MNVLADRVGGPGELAKRSRLSRRVIDKYRSGESEPNRPRLLQLAHAAGVAVEWLAAGEGPMEAERPGPLAPAGEPREGYVALPRYDIQAAAGAGAVVQAEQVVDWIYFKQEWLLRTLGVAPRHLAIIQAVGDSMAPTIQDGDLLIVDLREPKFRGDGIYVLAVGPDADALSVKRVAVKPLGDLVVSSDNQEFYGRQYDIPREELGSVRIVGRVVWVGGRI